MHDIFHGVAVIPIVTVSRAADAVPLAAALARGGLRVVEVSLRAPESLAAIAAIARHVKEVTVGAGMVLSEADIGRAGDAGARFLTSPGLIPELAAAGRAGDLPYLPGAVTPSEVMMARELGFSLLRFFPAGAMGGIATLAAYARVFSGLGFCASGGVTAENAAEYLSLANVPLVAGDWMAPADAVAAGDWRGIEVLALAARRLGPAQGSIAF